MFRLQVWLTPLLVVLTGALSVVAGTGFLFEHLFPPFEDQLASAKMAINGVLLEDANAAANRAAAVTVDPNVRALVKSKTPADEADPALGKVLLETVEGRLDKPAFAMVVAQDGTVLASVGAPPKDMGNAIAGLPLFAEAKLGVVRDGNLRDDRDLHVAAAPVFEGNKVGVVILGWDINGGYADRLAASIKRPIVIMRGNKRDVRMGAAFADVDTAELTKATGIGGFGAPAPELPFPVPGVPFLVSESDRYYASGVPLFDVPGAPVAVTAIDRNAAFSLIANVQLVVIAASLALAFLVFLLINSLRAAYRKPSELITDHLSRAAQGEQVGILPEAAVKGPLERLGRQINMILQNPQAGVSGRNVPPITAPPNTGPIARAPDGDGFAAGLSDETVQDPVYDPSGSGEGVAAIPESNLAPVSQAPVSEELENSSLSGLFDDAADDPLAAFRVGGGDEPSPSSQPPGPPPPDTVQHLPGTNAPLPSQESMESADRTVAFQVPDELLQESVNAPSGPPVMAPPPATNPGVVGSDDRTVVAEIPSELLDQAAPKPHVADAEEQHYRTVYQEFIDTRQQCGEDTSQLTYDRFVAKLMKNRAAIMDKYNSKSVRFQVYVKNNKAALRAVPVRD